MRCVAWVQQHRRVLLKAAIAAGLAHSHFDPDSKVISFLVNLTWLVLF